MKASDLLAGGLHDFSRYEKRATAPVTICEPLPIRPAGSFQPMIELDEELGISCPICAAFGQCCCRLHRDEASR